MIKFTKFRPTKLKLSCQVQFTCTFCNAARMQESFIRYNDAVEEVDGDLEYVLFRNEVERRRKEDAANRPCSLRSALLYMTLLLTAASIIGVALFSATVITDTIVEPLAEYDFKTDTFSARSYPAIERLLEDHTSNNKGDGKGDRVLEGTRSPSSVSPQLHEQIMKKMNTSADPCDSFYDHVCGGWEASYDLLPGEERHIQSFDEIMKRTTQQQFHTLDSNFDFITPFYQSCMRPSDVEESGDAALRPFFSLIDTVKDGESFFDVLGESLASSSSRTSTYLYTYLHARVHTPTL